MQQELLVQRSTFVRRKALARLTGERESTIKHYTEVGLLPFEQAERGLTRRYNVEASAERLKHIRGLQALGLSIEAIRERLTSL